MAPNPEVYPENVPGPESSTERASIHKYCPGPALLSEHSSVPTSVSEHQTVSALIPELSQDPALSNEFSQSPDHALKLSQEFAQAHKFPPEIAPDLESAPEPVPFHELVLMITSVLKAKLHLLLPGGPRLCLLRPGGLQLHLLRPVCHSHQFSSLCTTLPSIPHLSVYSPPKYSSDLLLVLQCSTDPLLLAILLKERKGHITSPS
ncbi:uncharacterized protein [Sinocyclocheilus grahami]|uniref:uncharacterized protein n=1 Tax=Sinocyclocheilus grahami TaxID=75366 RepID=UPI0007AD5024|nr:PREDICTED: uncharacterized protein LOC107573387 [Sinocyclocheilus grahami]